jgi:HAD superfamily hydrolase (TIGR01509 family)
MSTVLPRAVLFDVGMTLIHINGNVIVDCLAEAGIDGVDPADAVNAILLAAEARYLPLPRNASGDEKVAAHMACLLGVEPSPAITAFEQATRRGDLYSELDPGAHPTLSALRDEGVALAAVANAEGRLIEELAEFDLNHYFEVFIDSRILGLEKPDPRVYRAASDSLGVPLPDCWFVGDGLVNDVLGAQAAGVSRGILYDRRSLRTVLPGIWRINTLPELLTGGHT